MADLNTPTANTSSRPSQRVRMVRAEDVPQLLELASGIDGLMTTMPREPDRMVERVSASGASVESARATDGTETYFFVLEEDGAVIGTSAIYAAVGLDRPFYSYKIGKRSQVSPELDVRLDYRVLQPVNDYTGCAEVGTLYLSLQHRGGGRGRLLSLARFLFLAVHQERFGSRVMAELRGWTDDEGASPFWDAVGAKFYGLDLQTADRRSGHDARFIADLLPPYPIFIDLLPDEAQRVIGLANEGSKPAAAMLRRQGFRNNDYVDIFDAGLCLDAHISDLDVVRRSSQRTVRIVESTAQLTRHLHDAFLATSGLANFGVVQASVALLDDDISGDGSSGSAVVVEVCTARDLGVADGDTVTVYSLSPEVAE